MLRGGRLLIQLSGLAALFARRLELFVARGMNPRLASLEHVHRRDVTNRGVQALGVVAFDLLAHPVSRLLDGARIFLADALAFDRALHPLLLPVRLRIIRARAHVGHARHPVASTHLSILAKTFF